MSFEKHEYFMHHKRYKKLKLKPKLKLNSLLQISSDIFLFLANPGKFIERQVEKWSSQYEASKIHEIESMPKLIKWLKENAPESGPTTVVHGDFRYMKL